MGYGSQSTKTSTATPIPVKMKEQPAVTYMSEKNNLDLSTVYNEVQEEFPFH